MAPMEVAREKSFKNRAPKWLMLGGIFLLVVSALDIVFSIIVEEYWMITLCAFLVPLGIFICGRANALNDNIVDRRAKAFLKWENASENKKYVLLKDKIEVINRKIMEIEKNL